MTGQRILKTVSWALLAFSITFIITFIITGSFLKGGVIALICRALKVPAFYLHDLTWEKINSAKLVKNESGT
jgi:uncharacterized membrane protein